MRLVLSALLARLRFVVSNIIIFGNDHLLGTEIKGNDDIIIFQDGDISNEIGVFINNNTRYNEILETSKKKKIVHYTFIIENTNKAFETMKEQN